MIQRLFIKGRFPGLNQIIKAAKESPHKYAELKREWTGIVYYEVLQAKLRKMAQVFIKLTWHESDNRRDPDNVAAAKKFIFDGLVDSGILPTDSRKGIVGWQEQVIYASKVQGVEVEITGG